jgi:hypothetical protein
MITGILVAILGFLLLVVLRELYRKSRTAAVESGRAMQDLANLKVTGARAGDAISISGAGEQFSDLDFNVEKRTDCQSGERHWFELTGQYRNRPIALDVVEGVAVEAHLIMNPRELTLADLGLTEEDLAQIDERQDTGDNFQFQDKAWFFRFSKEAESWRAGVRQSACYFWRFEEPGGESQILVRKPEGEPFSAELAVKVNPDDITVFRG